MIEKDEEKWFKVYLRVESNRQASAHVTTRNYAKLEILLSGRHIIYFHMNQKKSKNIMRNIFLSHLLETIVLLISVS
jgi:hypothetical protein